MKIPIQLFFAAAVVPPSTIWIIAPEPGTRCSVTGLTLEEIKAEIAADSRYWAMVGGMSAYNYRELTIQRKRTVACVLHTARVRKEKRAMRTKRERMERQRARALGRKL